MKYIKLFEQVEPDIRVGDYVILNTDEHDPPLYNNFIKTHIGKISSIEKSAISHGSPWHHGSGDFSGFLHDIYFIYVKFIFNENEDRKGFDNIFSFHPKYIKYSAHTLEELKMILDSEKYNL